MGIVIALAVAWSATCDDARAAHAAVLLKRLDAVEPAVRRRAALALGHAGGPGVADALANALVHAGDDDDWFAAVVTGLDRLGPDGVDRVVDLAESGSAGRLRVALTAFPQMRSAAAAGRLPRMLGNPHFTADERVTLVALWPRYRSRPASAVAEFVGHFERNPHESAEVTRAALAVVAEVKHARAAGWVERSIDSADATVRVAALEAVGRGRYTSAVPRVLAVAADVNRAPADRVAAVACLRELHEPAAAAVCRQILGDAVAAGPKLRIEAMRTLAVIDNATALTIGEALLERAEAALVKEIATAFAATPDGTKRGRELIRQGRLPAESAKLFDGPP